LFSFLIIEINVIAFPLFNVSAQRTPIICTKYANKILNVQLTGVVHP
jgi:hypothetical protein